ncbi:MAG: hypothetical protein GXY85_12235 [Candidatus Brocadiaceae bacterium]|nr:hypothetical protein [Candidatus Brocadiaceae bacterium]
MEDPGLPRGYRLVRGTIGPEQAAALAELHATGRVPGAVRLARGNTRRTILLDLLGQVWKQYLRIGTREACRALRGDTCVRREFDNTVRALDAGLPAPRPLFAVERRRLGILRGQVIAFVCLKDARALGEVLDLRNRDDARAPTAEEREQILQEYAALIARLGPAGVRHGDLGARNLMLAGSGGTRRLCVLDWLTAEFDLPPDRDVDCTDLRHATSDLVRSGLPLREVRRFYDAYADAIGWPAERRRAVARWLLQQVRADRARFARRTVRHALTAGRLLVRRRLPDGRTAYVLRSDAETAARILAAAPPDAPAVDTPHAVTAWAAACIAERFRLPCRRVLGIVPETRRRPGAMALEPAAGTPLEAELQDTLTVARRLDDLRALVVLLHSFGLRFRRCTPGTIARTQDPVAALRSCGLAVQDPTALQARPGLPPGESWAQIAAYVASQCGQTVADAFALRARRFAARAGRASAQEPA